jgi:hypothetical protein
MTQQAGRGASRVRKRAYILNVVQGCLKSSKPDSRAGPECANSASTLDTGSYPETLLLVQTVNPLPGFKEEVN